MILDFYLDTASIVAVAPNIAADPAALRDAVEPLLLPCISAKLCKIQLSFINS